MTPTARVPVPIINVLSFEGPLDLLLQLVERRRLPIAEMSLRYPSFAAPSDCT